MQINYGRELLHQQTWKIIGTVCANDVVLLMSGRQTVGVPNGQAWVAVMTVDGHVGILPVTALDTLKQRKEESGDNGVQENRTPSMIETRKM